MTQPDDDDPGRAMLARAVELGLLTEAEAFALDSWAGDLATDMCNGTLTKAEVDARILARADADRARRGQA